MPLIAIAFAAAFSFIAASTFAGDSPGFVNAARNDKGERGIATFWDSQTSMKDCLSSMRNRTEEKVSAIIAGSRADQRRAVRRDAEPPAACEAGELGALTHGTAVTRLGRSTECGEMEKVRIEGGKHQGRVGCLARRLISDERMP